MKIKDESCTIVILGKWNREILSPQWVAKNIFDVPTIKVEFALNIGLPPRYETSDIRLIPSREKIIFVALSPSDEILGKMEGMAIKLVDTLQYTPVSAFGTNFCFTETMDKANLHKLFNLSDISNISDFGCVVKTNTIKRELVVKDRVLNLMVTQTGDEISFDFNFNYEVKEANEVSSRIVGASIENKAIAESLLDSVYGLSYDEEEEVSKA